MRLSIVTINLNQAAGLTKTLASVAAQTFRDFEHIVVDDGSDDGSVDAIRAHASALTNWVSEPDTGIFNAMNKGVRRARGEYVYFLNSGDWLTAPTVLADMLGRGGDEDIVYGDFLRPDGRGGTRYCRQPDRMTMAPYLDWGYCHQTIFYRRRLFEELGGYDESLKVVADWEFTVRALLARCTARHVPLAVAFYDAGGSSETNMASVPRERRVVLERLLPQAILHDLEQLRDATIELARLRPLATWQEAVRESNIFISLAMVARWWLTCRLGRRHVSKGGRA
ncbi:MAG: glycosyltransferase family 2 protein [Kiritimatiellae bacterium]|nr:glycosyltransferase family 2 protein [Kiritimatiellia bacterium]